MKMDSFKLSGAYKLFFETLANDSRLQIINLLRTGSRNVGEICSKTGFEQSMVSHNLKKLEHHGMIFMEKKGKFRYYSLNRNTIRPLLKLIDDHMQQYCCKILKGER
jgi:DNA-binding transcriptional ArsR family regulator